MNQAVSDTVEDLTVPEELLEAVTAKAHTLSLDIVGHCESICR